MFTSFTAAGDVHRHKVVHTGEKPHLCDTCGRGQWLLSVKAPPIILWSRLRTNYLIYHETSGVWLALLVTCAAGFSLILYRIQQLEQSKRTQKDSCHRQNIHVRPVRKILQHAQETPEAQGSPRWGETAQLRHLWWVTRHSLFNFLDCCFCVACSKHVL